MQCTNTARAILTSQNLCGTVGQQQHDISVVVAFAAQEGKCHQCGHEQQRKAQCVEELCGDKKSGQQVVVYDVVFLFKHPHAAGKSGVVESMYVLEVVEAYGPKA